MSYTSSIIFKYGNTENVKSDARTLREIFSRQGASLLIDVIADCIGDCAQTLSLSDDDCVKVREGLCQELREAIAERT